MRRPKPRSRALAQASLGDLLEELQRRPETQEVLYEALLTLRAGTRALARRAVRPMPPELPEWRDLTAAERKAIKFL